MSPQITSIFQRYDTNGDGVIGAWELKAMIDDGEIIVHDDLTVSISVVGLSTLPGEVAVLDVALDVADSQDNTPGLSNGVVDFVEPVGRVFDPVTESMT